MLAPVVLAIGLLGQVPPEDLACERAVEESICSWRLTVMPPPYRAWIDQLGAPTWRDREAAQAALLACGPPARRWLWWGRMSGDPEIRARCNAVIQRLHPCRACGGTGRSRSFELWPCWECQGAKMVWTRSP